MFAIGYFVTTTTCLTGAVSFKRRNTHNTTSDAAGILIEKKLRMTPTDLNLIIPESHLQQKTAITKTASKKQVAAKRGPEPRKTVSAPQPEKKPSPIVSVATNSLKTKQKQNLC